MADATKTRAETRSAIVEAAARLLREGGPAAVTTRGVAEEARVQAPTIYRLFGDKDGLLEAVAEQVMADFVEDKTATMQAAAAADADPLDDLRTSWRRQIEFGLANPAVFRLLSDPDRAGSSRAARSGMQILRARIHRLAAAGRLRVPEPRAVDIVHAAGVGVVQTLLAVPEPERDSSLGEAMLEAALSQILAELSPTAPVGHVASVIALRAAVPRLEALSEPERELLAEWLDRIVANGSSTQAAIG